LEKEADVMGARALQMKPFSLSDYKTGKSVQRAKIVESTTFNPMHQQLEDEDEDEAVAPEETEESTTINVGPFTYENKTVSMELLGQNISLGKDSAALKLPTTPIKIELPKLTGVSVLIPLYPGVCATAGLTITPDLNITFDSGTAELTSNILSISNVGISGKMGLHITATVGVEAGLAYIAGLEAGAFVDLGGDTNLSGSLRGEVNFKDNTSTVNLGLDGSAAITGKAGVFARAKLLGVAAIEKQFDIVSRTFARFVYSRNREYSKGWGHFLPEENDFKKIYTKEGPYILGEEIISPLHQEDPTGKPEDPTAD
jgi:hypothetical protein